MEESLGEQAAGWQAANVPTLVGVAGLTSDWYIEIYLLARQVER